MTKLIQELSSDISNYIKITTRNIFLYCRFSTKICTNISSHLRVRFVHSCLRRDIPLQNIKKEKISYKYPKKNSIPRLVKKMLNIILILVNI